MLSLFSVSGHTVGAAEESLEYAIKATYLYKFVPFVDWPPGSIGPANEPINLCVIGQDPFDGLIDRAVSGREIDGHPIAIIRMNSVGRRAGCQIMFAAGSREQSVRAALDAVRGTPVLTVTDAKPDQGPHGIINFVIVDGRIRFQIDDRAAADNGLKLSSKLMSLAVNVRPRD